jgi:carboxylesterase type B
MRFNHLLGVLSLVGQISLAKQPSAVIDSGVVVGTAVTLPTATAAVNQFLGIPFADPPERFSPPKPPKSWNTPLQVTALKPACIQQVRFFL